MLHIGTMSWVCWTQSRSCTCRVVFGGYGGFPPSDKFQRRQRPRFGLPFWQKVGSSFLLIYKNYLQEKTKAYKDQELRIGKSFYSALRVCIGTSHDPFLKYTPGQVGNLQASAEEDQPQCSLTKILVGRDVIRSIFSFMKGKSLLIIPKGVAIDKHSKAVPHTAIWKILF